MVKIHIKYQNESEFLYETVTDLDIKILLEDVSAIHNAKLKIERLCLEVEDLSKYGICSIKDEKVENSLDLAGLLEDQIEELNLNSNSNKYDDDYYIPNGGFVEREDPNGRRNGKAPNEEMANVLLKTVHEVKARLSKKQIECGISLSLQDVTDCVTMLRGAIQIVYEMGLPSHDPIQIELDHKSENDTIRTQIQTDNTDIIPKSEAEIWWAGKQFMVGKKLSDYIGKNEKTKIVAKLQKTGGGAPSRENAISAEEQKQMMLLQHRRREELKLLEEDDSDDSYLNSSWADGQMLKKSFQGLHDVRWKPK